MPSPFKHQQMPARDAIGQKSTARRSYLQRLVRAAALPIAVSLICMTAFAVISANAADAPPTVSVIAAAKHDVKNTVGVSGVIVARERVLVNSDIDGARISAIYAEEGSVVEKGQVLAVLDTGALEVQLLLNDAQLASAEAQLGQTRSALDTAVLTCDEAGSDLARGERLAAKGLLSQEILDQRRSALSRAQAAVKSAEQAIKVAEAAIMTVAANRRDIQLKLSRSQIVAPTAGRVISRTARLGTIAVVSGQPLFSIAQDDELEFEADIPQNAMPLLAVGQSVEISGGGAMQAMSGTLRFLAPALADGTRLGRARVTLTGGSSLPIGAFSTARIDVHSKSGIFLPISAISSIDSDPQVKIVRGTTVEQKQVRLGSRTSGLVEVRSGIDVGDLVVLKTASFFNQGDQVAPYRVTARIGADESRSGSGR